MRCVYFLAVVCVPAFFLNHRLRVRIYSIVIFIVISTIPIGMWVVRNFLISGTLTGEGKSISTHTLLQNLDFTYKTIHDWGFFPPKGIIGSIMLIIFMILLIGFIARCVTKGNISTLRPKLVNLGPAVLYIIIYISPHLFIIFICI